MKTEYSEGQLWNEGNGYDEIEKPFMADIQKYDKKYGTGYSLIGKKVSSYYSMILYGFLASEAVTEGKIYSLPSLCKILGLNERTIKGRITKSKGFIQLEKGICIPMVDIEILKVCEVIFGKYEEYLIDKE